MGHGSGILRRKKKGCEGTGDAESVHWDGKRLQAALEENIEWSLINSAEVCVTAQHREGILFKARRCCLIPTEKEWH